MITLAAAALFWIAVALVRKFNWDLGGYKAPAPQRLPSPAPALYQSGNRPA
ncbi:MAG: hypothetical protein ACLQJR_02125 [Stellaceae bacterium]